MLLVKDCCSHKWEGRLHVFNDDTCPSRHINDALVSPWYLYEFLYILCRHFEHTIPLIMNISLLQMKTYVKYEWWYLKKIRSLEMAIVNWRWYWWQNVFVSMGKKYIPLKKGIQCHIIPTHDLNNQLFTITYDNDMWFDCFQYIDGWVQHCRKSSVLAMELLPSCTKLSLYFKLLFHFADNRYHQWFYNHEN